MTGMEKECNPNQERIRMAKKRKKKPHTPRSRVKAFLRRLSLHSRERAAVMKKAGYRCLDCDAKQSKARGKEVKVEAHHNPPIDWDGIVDLIFERILDAPQEILCEACHRKAHENKKLLTKEIVETYRNPDKRCVYPFEPNPVGYCWAYAHHVDGTERFEDMGKICPSCEYWKENEATC